MAGAGLSENGAGPSHATAVRRILALGGHDFTSKPPDRAVCELLLRLATERGGERPKMCILPTASGDTSEQIGRASTALSASAPASPPTSPSSASAGGRWRSATTS